MHIVAHDHFGNVTKMPITSVVVYDDAGVPIAVTAKLMDRVAMTSHFKDQDFHKVLKSLGMDVTTVVDDLALPITPY